MNAAGAVLGAVGLLAALAALGWAVAERRRSAVLQRRLAGVARRAEPMAPADRLSDGAEPERVIDAAVGHVRGMTDASMRLAQALDAIPQGVVIVDAAGAVVHRNRSAAGIESARHGDALVGAALDELLVAAVTGNDGSRTLDLFGPPRRTVVVRAEPLEADGARVGAVAVIDDVSEVRRLDAVRRDFVANISHELKTPVGAISLLAETIAVEEDPEVSARLAARMVDEAARVGHTIEDLLVLSQIETEEAEVREPVHLDLVVAEATERIGRAAEQLGITIRPSRPVGRCVVDGDRRQLVSAVYNLLDNAVKYSDAGSSVDVEVRCLEAGDGPVVELLVRDRGIGIPARDLERVFERFYRVDQARSRRTGGTGLGLAIVRHVAGNHRGEVHVTSRLGEGSTFTLSIPASGSDDDATGRLPRPAEATGVPA